MSLYLKYRPQNFKTVVGQKHATETLRNAIRNHVMTHAYLFSGPRGTGKTSLARIIAKAINCTALTSESEPCNACDICQAINKNRLVDLIEIDAASNRGIDEMRELREKIVFHPSQAKAKVYIIDEVHMLTKEAFNALLKTLEEPPEHAFFILATTEFHKIPETIISRCQQYNFKRIGNEDIVKRLTEIAKEEGIKAEPQALSLIAKVANGGLRDAIGLFEQMAVDKKIELEKVAENLGMGSAIHVEKFFTQLISRNALKAIETVAQVNAEGHSLEQFVSELLSHLREQMLINIDVAKDLNTIIHIIDCFSEARLQISQAIIPQLPIEIAIVKACQYHIEPTVNKVAAPSETLIHKTVATRPEETDPRVQMKPIITLEAIQQNWQRIIDHIETPFVRMAFVDAEPERYENDKLYLRFNSSSLKEKIANAANQAVVQKALETVFGTKIPLDLEVKKVNLKVERKEKGVDASVIEMAKEVFGNIME
jgi:DNA polymerase-3 subunit gamma/tau